MEHLSNDLEDCPNQHKNSHKLCSEMGHPILSLLESQWKLKQQHQNFPMKGKPSEEEINPKEQDCESHSQGSESHSQGSE